MRALRNAAYLLVFFGLSVPIIIVAPLSALFGRAALIRYSRGWVLFHRWCVRHLLGIRNRYEGPRPTGQVFYAGKHQSIYETIDLMVELGSPAIIMRREYARIPIWGWIAKRYGIIMVDRSASAGALRSMLREAKVALGEGRSVLLFPEGTRVAPGEQPPLKSGFAGLYKMLGLPVVPVASDTGLVWPRHGMKNAGTVTFRFGEPIPPGLPRDDVEARVHAAINVLDCPSPSGEGSGVGDASQSATPGTAPPQPLP